MFASAMKAGSGAVKFSLYHLLVIGLENLVRSQILNLTFLK